LAINPNGSSLLAIITVLTILASYSSAIIFLNHSKPVPALYCKKLTTPKMVPSITFCLLCPSQILSP
jgi:hypothetical protein